MLEFSISNGLGFFIIILVLMTVYAPELLAALQRLAGSVWHL